MKKFIFFKNISNKYLKLQNDIRKNKKLINWFKIWIVFAVLFTVVGVYGYLVNVSSTKWYFLKQQKQKLAQAKFDRNIVQLEILEKQKEKFQKDNVGRYTSIDNMDAMIHLSVSKERYVKNSIQKIVKTN